MKQNILKNDNTNKSFVGKFIIVGGDERQAYLANSLLKEGYSVASILSKSNHIFDKSIKKYNDLALATKKPGIYVFPIPFLDVDGFINSPFSDKKLKPNELISLIKENSYIFGGKIPKEVFNLAKEKNIRVVDLLDREEFGILNGIPTAEGALEIAIKERSTTIFGSKCLVTGYGNIAKPLAKILSAMGASVDILTRSLSSTAKAESSGYNIIKRESLVDRISDYDIVFNTAPSPIFSMEILKNANKASLFIDLASKPGGIDFKRAEELNLQVIWALSLPAKTAPVTAGRIVKKAIINVLSEGGENNEK